MTDKKITLYIGEREIKVVEGNTVTFIDDTKESYTTKQLEYIISKEPLDASSFYELEIKNIIKGLLDELEIHDVKKGMLDAILQRLVGSYNDAFHTAIGKAFGYYEEGQHPATYAEKIRISDIKRLNDQ